MRNNEATTDEELKELVIARLQTLPPDKEISIGADGSYKRDELIEHIKKDDEIGKTMVEVEMTYLRSFKDGALYAE